MFFFLSVLISNLDLILEYIITLLRFCFWLKPVDRPKAGDSQKIMWALLTQAQAGSSRLTVD